MLVCGRFLDTKALHNEHSPVASINNNSKVKVNSGIKSLASYGEHFCLALIERTSVSCCPLVDLRNGCSQ